MRSKKSRLQVALYRVFLVTGAVATVLGVLAIWGFVPPHDTGLFLLRVMGTCMVLAVASAFAMSATRLVGGRPPEDDGG